MLLPVGISYNKNREKTISVENVINLQPEVTFGGRQPVALITTPGLDVFATPSTTTNAVGRAIIFVRGKYYAVIGRRLYKIDPTTGDFFDLGAIDGTGICGMSASQTEIHIAVLGTGYFFNIGTEVLLPISDLDYPQGKTSAFQNGRFVTEDPTAGTGGRFFFSELLDANDWSALDFATAERKTDDTIAVASFGDTLLVCGTGSIEFWSADALGFIPVGGGLLPYGLSAIRSITQISNSLYFLDSNGQVRSLRGYQAQVISTPAVEEALDNDPDAEAFSYVFEGKEILEISTSSITLCYDMTSSQMIGKPIWFEKQTIKSQKAIRHRARGFAQNTGQMLVLSFDDGSVYEITRDVIPDVREFTIMPPVNDGVKDWNILDEVELLGRTGTGAIPDVDPQVIMSISRNNGFVFGEQDWNGLGTVGDYAKRVRWRRLGRFQQMAIKFRQTDPYDWTILGVRIRGR